MAIAHRTLGTPMLKALPQAAQDLELRASVPFPLRLGELREYAELVLFIIRSPSSQRRGDPARRRTSHGAALNMLVYTRNARIEWGDCDPAGIVFFPRYFAIVR